MSDIYWYENLVESRWTWHHGEWLIMTSHPMGQGPYRVFTCGGYITEFKNLADAKAYAEWREKGAE